MSAIPRAIPVFLSGLLIFALFASGVGAAVGLPVLAEPSVELIFGLAGGTAAVAYVHTLHPNIGPTLDEQMFSLLVTDWYRERGAKSSTSEIVLCPSYQHIIGLGENALPLIFRQLRKEGDKPDNWFWALHAITSDNPVPEQLRGNRREMAKLWLEWGRDRGYA